MYFVYYDLRLLVYEDFEICFFQVVIMIYNKCFICRISWNKNRHFSLQQEKILQIGFETQLLTLNCLFGSKKFQSRTRKKSKKAGRKCQEKIFWKVMLISINKKRKKSKKTTMLSKRCNHFYLLLSFLKNKTLKKKQI